MAEQTFTVFIGKVPSDVDVAFLETELSPFGASNVRVLAGKGCAFADFATWESADQVIQSFNGQKLTATATEGLNLKMADQKGQKSQPAQQGFQQSFQQSQPPARAGPPKLFVGNLAPGVNEDMLYQVACQFGAIQEVKLFQKNPAQPCGFVTFASSEEAESCINGCHGMEHELSAPGKTLNVKFADQQGGQQGASGPVVGSMGYGGNFAGGAKGGGKGAYLAAAAPRMASQPQIGPGGPAGGRPSSGGPGGPAGGSQKIFVGKLPPVATEDFLWGLMAPFGEVIEAKIHRKNGAGPPCGFVRFATADEAEQAISLHGQLGRFIVKYADDKQGDGAGAKRSFGNAFAGGPSAAVWA